SGTDGDPRRQRGDSRHDSQDQAPPRGRRGGGIQVSILGNLGPVPASRRPRKRVGRGPGSGHGKTSCRGQKGQKARRQVRRGFEGGQMPLQRRLPKRGFYSRERVENQVVKLSRLEVFKAGDVVDLESLARKGIIRKSEMPVKILADGDIHVALTV